MAKPAKSADSLFDDLPAASKPQSTKGPARSRGEESYTAADIEVLTGDFDLHGRRKYPCFALPLHMGAFA